MRLLGEVERRHRFAVNHDDDGGDDRALVKTEGGYEFVNELVWQEVTVEAYNEVVTGQRWPPSLNE